MNPERSDAGHKTDMSFNGTHKLASQTMINADDDVLKDDNSNDASSHSHLYFYSENSKFDSDVRPDGGPSSSLCLDSPSLHSTSPSSTRVKKTRGKQKINIEFINEKNKRYTTFSKRKTGLMKKAHELSSLTGAEVLLLVASETNHVYTFATTKLRNMIQSDRGKELIRTCLACDEKPGTSQSPAPPSLQPAQPPSLLQSPAQQPQLQQLPVSQQQPPASQPPPISQQQSQQQQQTAQGSQAGMVSSNLPRILLNSAQDSFSVANYAANASDAMMTLQMLSQTTRSAAFPTLSTTAVSSSETASPQTIFVQIPIPISRSEGSTVLVKKEKDDGKQQHIGE